MVGLLVGNVHCYPGGYFPKNQVRKKNKKKWSLATAL